MSYTIKPIRPNGSRGITSDMETITPERAAAMLAKNSPNNRPTSPRNIEVLAEAMLRGEWQEHSQFVLSTDGTLLDGQHRCLAIMRSGVTVRASVIQGCPPDYMETIDTGKKRTMGDVLHFRGEKNARALAAALMNLWRIESGTMRNNRAATNKQLLEVLERHPSIREHVGLSTSQSINRIGVGIPPAVTGTLHYLFHQIDPEDCRVFFEGLTTGADLATGSPILALRQRLETAKNNSGKAVRGVRPAVAAAWTIKAWNAWRQGREVAQIKWTIGGASPEAFPLVDGMTYPAQQKAGES